MTTLIADIEADGLYNDVTTIWQLSICDYDEWIANGNNFRKALTSYNDQEGYPSLRKGLQRLSDADIIVGHNFLGYDVPVVHKLYGTRYIDPAKVIDTLAISRASNPERHPGHALEHWGTTFKVPKPEHEDWSRWSLQMEHRCNEDVRINTMLYHKFRKWPAQRFKVCELEHGSAWESSQAVSVGFRLNVPFTQKLADTLTSEVEELATELREIFPPILVPKKPSDPVKVLKVINRNHALHGVLDPGVEFCPVVEQEFNPGSRQQIAKRLIQKYGWKPSKFTPGGSPEVSADTLQDLNYPEAASLVLYLHKDKQLSQINSAPKKDGSGGGWLHHVTKEGRVHANLNPCRTVTGRPGCSSPNLQQVSKKKDPLTKEADPRMRQCWIPSQKGDLVVSGWDRNGIAIRKKLKKNRLLVGVDAEGLELRCLGHYLKRYDDGEYIRTLLEGKKEDGTDVHSVAMRLLGMYDRDETKRAEYGWLYGAGDKKLGLIIWQDAYKAGKPVRLKHLGVKRKKGRRVSFSAVGGAARRKLEQGITGLGELSHNVRARGNKDKHLRALDGRKLRVHSAHKALNYWLQSAGAIVMKQAITLMPLRLEEAGLEQWIDWQLVMWIHDELQIECDPDVAELVGQTVAQCITDAGPLLNFKCPLAGEYKIGTNWAETH